MKRFVLMMILSLTVFLCIAPKQAHAQTTWETLWIKSSYPVPAFNWMKNLFSGLAYDRMRNKLYVIEVGSDGAGTMVTGVWILDPATGDTIGKLPLDLNIINQGFSLGMFRLFKIQVSDEGGIYASGLVAPIWGICHPGPPPNCDPNYLGQGPVKIFKWDSPTSMPKLVYSTPNNTVDPDYMTYARWGDALAIIGTKDSTQIFISGGSYSNKSFNPEFNVLQAKDSLANEFHIKRKSVSALNGIFSHGLAPTGVNKNRNVWANSSVRVTSLQSQTSPPISIDDISANIDRITSATVRYFELPDVDRKIVITCDGKNENGGDSTKARVIDVTVSNSFFLEGEPTPPINNRALKNTSGTSNYAQDVDYKLEGHRLTVFVLMSNNGIGAFRMTYDLLPVELTSFRAIPVIGNIELRWRVTQETNNYGFEIQRSLDGGKNFELIGFVQGRGTTNETKDYLYFDPIKDINVGLSEVYYRLKQIDTDGKYKFSPTVQVLLTTTPTDVVLGQNYPNPFSAVSNENQTAITYQLTKPGFVTLKIYNTLGEEVKTLVSEQKESGTHIVNVNASDLASGIYHYQLSAFGKTLQKRMVVMK